MSGISKFDNRQVVQRSALSMIGNAANEQMNTLLSRIDAEMAKLYEDRNLLLVSDGTITYPVAGTTLVFSSNLRLHVNSKVAGGSPVVIDLGSTTRTLSASGRMLYAVINRTGGTATITDDSATLPAVTAANQEVVLIAKRVDAADGTKRVYFRNGFSISAGKSSRFDQPDFLQPTSSDDTTTTGSNTTIASFSNGIIRLTNGSLVSISGIPAGLPGQMLILENQTGTQITINNQETGASAPDRIYTGTGGNAPMPANSTFIFTYDATAARWMLTGGTGSGSGSSINYITFGNAEAGTQGWATYKDAAGAQPVDGTGGSPTVTFTTSTSAPLRGTASFLFTKDAVNRQGEGVSYDFTIDSADKAKVLQINFDYLINSGTYADGDLTCYIFDVTNSIVIQPAGFSIQNILVSAKQTATFQTSSNSTSYRLIFHVASTSALAYVVKMDNITVGPQVTTQGAFASDWISYTPTGAWTTNTSYLGKWRRVGDSMEIMVEAALSGAPNAADFKVTIPAGYSIDTSKIAYGNLTTYSWLGNCSLLSGGNSYGSVFVGYQDSSTLTLWAMTSGAINNHNYSPVSQTIPATFMAADKVWIQARVPIVGWGGSQAISSDTDTRVVAARYKYSSGSPQHTSSGSFLDLPSNLLSSSDGDTHGGYNTTTNVYTVQVPGWYETSGLITFDSNATGTRGARLQKNGIDVANATEALGSASLNGFVPYSFLVYCIAGDLLKIQAYQSSGGTLNYTTNPVQNYIQFKRLSGPSQIAASESISLSYGRTTSQSIPDSTQTDIIWTTSNFDTHGSMNTSTGIATVPAPGIYEVDCSLEFEQNSSGRRQLSLYRNNLEYFNYENIKGTDTTTTNQIIKGTTTIKCIAGDTLKIIAFQTSGISLQSAPNGIKWSVINIKRIG